MSLVIKTRVVQNVHRMSKIQSDRQEDIQFARQTDKVTERQNDSMADSRAAKEPALVFTKFDLTRPTPPKTCLKCPLTPWMFVFWDYPCTVS